MKRRFRLLAALLALCLCLLSLSSCALGFLQYLMTEDETQETVEETQPLQPSWGDADPENPTYDLTYTLTEQDLDDFCFLLEMAESMVNDPAVKEDAIAQTMETVEEKYYHIATQAQLAYIYYCLDMANEQNAETYLFAQSLGTDAYDAYTAMCKRIDASNAPHKTFFFHDWTEEEIEDMRGFSQEHVAISKENDALLVAYRSLDEANFTQGAAEAYLTFLQNNNRLAALEGYSDYRTYAYAELYERDFTADDVKTMRAYVKEYLVPMVESTYNSFAESYSELWQEERETVESLLTKNYANSAEFVLKSYLDGFDYRIAAGMRDALYAENSYFATSENAYEGAFTGYFYAAERPYCYFGPSYKDVYTVIHEMGHYLAYLENGETEIQLDLAEVHSQGNEWLFTAHLIDALNSDLSRTMIYYQIYSTLTASIIVPLIVDEFEERCYLEAPTDAARLDAIMDEVLAGWGDKSWLETYVGDMHTYWRWVVLESPAYYVSYAVSAVAAVQLYGIARGASLDVARETYLSLLQGLEPDLGFLEALEAAEIPTPFEERAYTFIPAIFP